MLNLNNSNISEPKSFPEIPELSAVQRARLFSYIMMVHQSFVTYMKLHPNDEFIYATGSLYASMTSILLDGSSTVKEFLDRDQERRYEIIGKDIVVVEGGVCSFICPSCGKQISFSADDEQLMEEIRKCGSLVLCCPNCAHQHKPAKQAFADYVFGGNGDEQ